MADYDSEKIDPLRVTYTMFHSAMALVQETRVTVNQLIREQEHIDGKIKHLLREIEKLNNVKKR